MTNAQRQAKRLKNSTSLLAQLQAVLTAYQDSEGVEADSAVRDALTDLRHLADIHSLDFASIDESAHDGYLEELAEDELI